MLTARWTTTAIALAVAGLCLVSGCHRPPQTAPTSERTEWSLPKEAKDTDRFCAPVFDDFPYQFCRSVGEVRAFLHSHRAEP